MKKLTEISNALDLTKKYPGYFHKRIFRMGIFSCVILLGLVAYTNNFTINFIYAECKETQPCSNPFYACTLDDMMQGKTCMNEENIPAVMKQYSSIEYLQPGEVIGTKPNFLANYFSFFCILIMASCFGVNHIIFRRSGNVRTRSNK